MLGRFNGWLLYVLYVYWFALDIAVSDCLCTNTVCTSLVQYFMMPSTTSIAVSTYIVTRRYMTIYLLNLINRVFMVWYVSRFESVPGNERTGSDAVRVEGLPHGETETLQ